MLNLSLLLFGYLLGSISSAVIVCRLMALPDPKMHGSKNPGATNVLRLGGKKAAAIVLAGDVLKGAVPVFTATVLSDNSVVIALVGGSAFLGHLYPLFFGFKGSKGVATACGVFIGWSAPLIALLFGIWLLVALIFRYSSLAALTVAMLTPPLAWWLLPEPGYFSVSLGIAGLTLWRHRNNFRQLMSGTEDRIRLNLKQRG